MTTQVKGMFKLHGIESANGTSRSSNNATFYSTYEEALNMAKLYVSKGTCSGIVIYRAYEIVEPAEVPIVVTKVDCC